MRMLFLCTGNSCRSQMAEGWANFLGKGAVQAFSAGTSPSVVNPLAMRAMAEVHVDISGQESKSLAVFGGQPFDLVVTVCDRAREQCPIWPGARERLHWSIDDPAEATGSDEARMPAFRRTRDELAQRIRLLLSVKHLG